MHLAFDAWYTIAVVVAAIAMLVWERFSPDYVLLGAVCALLVGGVLSPTQALAGS